MNYRNLIAPVTALALTGMSMSAQADILLNDQFLDGSLANGSEAGEIDTDWYGINTNTGGTPWSIRTTAGLTGSVMGHVASSDQNTTMLASFTEDTLVNPGDQISLSLKVRTISNSNSGTLALRLGNDNLTPTISNEAGLPAGTASDDNLILVFAQPNSSSTIDNTTVHTVLSVLELRADGDYDLSTSIDGDPFAISIVDSDIRTFNQVRIFWNGLQPRVDDIVVETVIPEPGSMALLGLGGIAMLARRRNR